MLTINLTNQELEKSLLFLQEKTNLTLDEIVANALKEYINEEIELIERIEDVIQLLKREDIFDVWRKISSKNKKRH